MATEIWTAKEKMGDGDKELIIFDVLDKKTKVIRQEEHYAVSLPLMMETGGTGAITGMLLRMQPLPWRFTKTTWNGQIYLEGKSIGGDESYHPIED